MAQLQMAVCPTRFPNSHQQAARLFLSNPSGHWDSEAKMKNNSDQLPVL